MSLALQIAESKTKYMNSILLSFLCGAAFIGGAVATTVLVLMVKNAASKEYADAIKGYWERSLAKHDTQLKLIERIVLSIEKRNNET